MDGSNVAAVVLAAGEGRRLGGREKALLRLATGETFLERIAATARAAGLGQVVVVSGPRPLPLVPGVRIVENPAPDRGMLSSIQAGLRALEGAPSGALIWPVDCPRVEAATIAAILAAAARAPIVVPCHAGRGGHPAFFARALFAELLAAPESQGARAVVRRDPARRLSLEVPAPEVLDDVDTPEDHARIAGEA